MLVMQLKAFNTKSNEALIKRITRRQIAWAYCLGQSLRDKDPFEHLDKFLSPTDFEALKDHKNKPLALLDQHSQDLKQLRDQDELNVFHQVQLDNTLVRLCDAMGKAERIKTTVYPTTYSFFMHSLIYIFIILLSVSLSEIDGLFEIPLLIIITVPFLLLEQTAKDMQDPFSGYATDTPVTAIANTIEVNLKQLIGDMDAIVPVKDNGFYVD
jgi:putative membrane protein